MSVESLAGINDIIGPSAGVLLRRRVFGHAGFTVGLVILVLQVLLQPGKVLSGGEL